MKKLKSTAKKIKVSFNKYVNGTKGVISIFLALIMVPFLAVSLLITESIRYQNAIELVDELLDMVGLSTMADYDKYLEERFGVLALDQKKLPYDRFNNYIELNTPALTNNFKYDSSSVTGVYDLGNNEVLKTQLLEFSETTVAAELIYEGFNISDFVDKIYETLHLDGLHKITDATGKTADFANAVVDMVDAVEKLNGSLKAYDTAYKEYAEAGNKFIKDSKNLISKLKEAKKNLNPDEEEKKVYSDDAVKDAIKTLRTTRDDYSKKIKILYDATEKARVGIVEYTTKSVSIGEKFRDATAAMGEVTGGKDINGTVTDYVFEQFELVNNVLKKYANTQTSDQIAKERELYKAQKYMVDNAKFTKKKPDNSNDIYYIDINSTDSTLKKYKPINPEGIPSGLPGQVDRVYQELTKEQSQDEITHGQGGLLTKFLDLIGEITKVTALYDGDLDAEVAHANFYNYTGNAMSTTHTAILNSFSGLKQAGSDIVNAKNPIDALSAIASLLTSIGNFFNAVFSWIGETIGGFANLLSNTEDMLDTLLLSAYCTYNLPCRTTYKESSLLGYDYNKIFDMNNGTRGTNFSGSFDDLDTLISNNREGTDPGFRGAELEYIVVGSANEIANQSATFFDLYMFRLTINALNILGNPFVKGIAAGANVAGWVVYLFYMIVEPMIDTILLVNGSEVDLIKSDMYLSPKGLKNLTTALVGVTGLSQHAKDLISGLFKTGEEDITMSGAGAMNYPEHLLFLILLGPKQNQILDRIKNVMTLEARQYYKDDYAFAMDQTYTYIKADVDGNLPALFDVGGLTTNGPFKIHRTRYIGY